MTVRVVLAGGGTSGHVLPALAVAESLREFGVPNENILYVGARRGVENKLVPEAGVRLETFDVSGLQRSLSPRSLLRNIAFLPRLALARRGARRLLREFEADVVVSVGGYASLPAVLAARAQKVPVVVITYDRRPGRSSEMTARWASATAAAFPDTRLPRARHTGAPVRRAVREVDRLTQRDAARARLGVGIDEFFVVVVGGSLGSGVLNDAAVACMRESRNDPGLHLRLVAGERYVDEARAAVASVIDSSSGVVCDVVGYEPDMASVYAAADLLVARGGAGTVAEVAVTGVPAVLVPWSGAADDHQTENVRWLSDRDAAVMLRDETVVAQLTTTIAALRADSLRRLDLGRRAHQLGELNRRNEVARLVLEVADGSGGKS